MIKLLHGVLWQVFRVVMDNYMNDDGDTDIAHHDHVFGELAERREKK